MPSNTEDFESQIVPYINDFNKMPTDTLPYSAFSLSSARASSPIMQAQGRVAYPQHQHDSDDSLLETENDQVPMNQEHDGLGSRVEENQFVDIEPASYDTDTQLTHQDSLRSAVEETQYEPLVGEAQTQDNEQQSPTSRQPTEQASGEADEYQISPTTEKLLYQPPTMTIQAKETIPPLPFISRPDADDGHGYFNPYKTNAAPRRTEVQLSRPPPASMFPDIVRENQQTLIEPHFANPSAGKHSSSLSHCLNMYGAFVASNPLIYSTIVFVCRDKQRSLHIGIT